MKMYFFTQGMHYSLAYFTLSFAEALGRKGVDWRIFNVENELHDYFKLLKSDPPDCTFATVGKDILNYDFCLSPDTQIPHFAFCVDHYIHYTALANHSSHQLGFVDELGCNFFRLLGFNNTCFLPHATDASFEQPPTKDYKYDVVMVGKCFDYESNRKLWPSQFPKAVCQLMNDAVETLLDTPALPFAEFLIQELCNRNISFDGWGLYWMFRQVENYLRGKERMALVRALKSCKIAIFGNTAGGKGTWSSYLSHCPHVQVFDGRVSFRQMLSLARQSKIFLNSTPSFKNGGHERIFNGLIAGSLVVTNDNLFVNKHFKDKENILLFRYGQWKEIDDKVCEYLANEPKRKEAVEKGKAIVLAHHTWDNRADTFLRSFQTLEK